MSGWIKTHRTLLFWEWYTSVEVFKLFMHCLLKANHEPKKWHGIEIQSGQFVTSLQNLAIESGLSVRQVRTALNKLKATQEVTHETTASYSIITINNWDKWQMSDTVCDKLATSERQAIDKPSTTTKERKEREEYKEVYVGEKISPITHAKKKFSKPTIEEIKEYCIEQSKNIDVLKFYNFYESKNWYVGKNKMSNWKAAIASWERNNTKSERTEIVSGNHYKSLKDTETLLATYKQAKENATAPTANWSELGSKLRRLK